MREIGSPDHASTEQLSALLDDRAEPGERWFLTDHVEECAECAAELDGLRSVRALLRAMPVHLPPRNFTIPVPITQARRRPSRLIPITRALSALAAVLCVVFFSADALMLGSSAPKQFQDGAGAMQITTVTKTNGGEAPVARSAAESGRAAAAEARSEYPASAAAAPAPPPPAAPAAKPAEAAKPAAAAARPAAPADAAKPAAPAEAAKPAAPAAAARSAEAPNPASAAAAVAPRAPAPAASPAAPADTAARSAPPAQSAPAQAAAAPTLGPLGTIAPFQATQQPALATMPPRATSVAVVAPPQQAPANSGSAIAPAGPPGSTAMPVRVAGIEVTVFRVTGLVFGVLAAAMLIWSLALGRKAHTR